MRRVSECAKGRRGGGGEDDKREADRGKRRRGEEREWVQVKCSLRCRACVRACECVCVSACVSMCVCAASWGMLGSLVNAVAWKPRGGIRIGG